MGLTLPIINAIKITNAGATKNLAGLVKGETLQIRGRRVVISGVSSSDDLYLLDVIYYDKNFTRDHSSLGEDSKQNMRWEQYVSSDTKLKEGELISVGVDCRVLNYDKGKEFYEANVIREMELK